VGSGESLATNVENGFEEYLSKIVWRFIPITGSAPEHCTAKRDNASWISFKSGTLQIKSNHPFVSFFYSSHDNQPFGGEKSILRKIEPNNQNQLENSCIDPAKHKNKNNKWTESGDGHPTNTKKQISPYAHIIADEKLEFIVYIDLKNVKKDAKSDENNDSHKSDHFEEPS
jgi:hypothetical protein